MGFQNNVTTNTVKCPLMRMNYDRSRNLNKNRQLRQVSVLMWARPCSLIYCCPLIGKVECGVSPCLQVSVQFT
jgi:hypothetical protein